MTTDSQGLARIIIAGEDVPVPGALKIVTFKDPGGFSFYSTTTNIPISSQLWYDRVRKGKVIRTREELKEVVHLVVLHTDCTRNSKQCYMVLVNRGLSTHFMIDWDGTIYQATDVIHCAAHAGGGVNMQSVGIDLNNLLLPFHPGDPDKPYRVAVGAGHDEQFQDPLYRRPEASEFEYMKLQNSVIRSYGYTDQQYQALTALLRALSAELPLLSPSTEEDENPIPRHPMDEKGKVIATALQDGDAQGWRGVLGHWHITPGKWDPGPGFDWDRMYHSLRGEDNFFPVELEPNRKRGSVVTEKDMGEVAARYFENNERGTGGYYGVGVNQAWHGGVHIRVAVGSPVQSMFTGHVVAARLGPTTALGSNNFVVIRHVLPMPTTHDPGRKMTLYSLYMHLSEQDLSDAALADSTRKDVPKWLHDLYRISRIRDDAQASEEKRPDPSGNKNAAKDKSKNKKDKEPQKAAADGPDDSEIAQDIQEMVDRTEKRPYLEFGPGLSALRAGKVAYFPWKSESETENLKVPSGSLLGYSGEFGPERTREALIHVELFADKSWREAIDLALHSDSFSVMEEDTPGTLHIQSAAVLRMFGAKRKVTVGTKKFLFDETRLRPDDIQRFFESPEREADRGYLRKAIIRHVSEWSDQVDWIKALSDAQDWAGKCQHFEELLQDQSQRYRNGVFSSAILEILPFIWLTEDTAKNIGLDVTEWDGTLYHFHPVHFLMWLTFKSSNRVRVFAKSKTRKQLEKEQKKTIEKAQEQRFSQGPAGVDGEELLDESLFVDLGAQVPNPKELLDPFRGLRRRGLWRWTFGDGGEQGG